MSNTSLKNAFLFPYLILIIRCRCTFSRLKSILVSRPVFFIIPFILHILVWCQTSPQGLSLRCLQEISCLVGRCHRHVKTFQLLIKKISFHTVFKSAVVKKNSLTFSKTLKCRNLNQECLNFLQRGKHLVTHPFGTQCRLK